MRTRTLTKKNCDAEMGGARPAGLGRTRAKGAKQDALKIGVLLMYTAFHDPICNSEELTSFLFPCGSTHPICKTITES